MPRVDTNIEYQPVQNYQYEPTTWKAGDTVTSTKLNNLEQGISASNMTIQVVNSPGSSCDKTWQEIYNGNYYFIISKGLIDGVPHKTILYITNIYCNGENDYRIEFIGMTDIKGYFMASTPTSYPVFQPQPA